MKRKELFLWMLAAATGVVRGQQLADVPEHGCYILAVDEYVPAPGQFVNTMPQWEEGDTPATMAAKCTEAIGGNRRGLVSLGAWGGYITFHFDHSIANIAGQRDFCILGNALQSEQAVAGGGGAEPGVVMVSKDVNGNGLPDDPWYELAGSCDVDSVLLLNYCYELTYRRDGELQAVPWSDNLGRSGAVPRNIFHRQEYFPGWMEDEITFTGTLLPANAVDVNGDGKQWLQMFFRYGYADNRPNSDREGCSMDISWAVDADRRPVQLDFVDFVRVYTGVNQACGLLGESSTEVMGAEDLHLEASLAAIREARNPSGVGAASVACQPACEVSRHAVDGRCVSASEHGLHIIRMNDGTTRKVMTRTGR
ncbi:MAG: hypothetical protein NC388_10050 [Clostridium sp.]|nr:hypothetical protein [Clostridium sp.]